MNFSRFVPIHVLLSCASSLEFGFCSLASQQFGRVLYNVVLDIALCLCLTLCSCLLCFWRNDTSVIDQPGAMLTIHNKSDAMSRKHVELGIDIYPWLYELFPNTWFETLMIILYAVVVLIHLLSIFCYAVRRSQKTPQSFVMCERSKSIPKGKNLLGTEGPFEPTESLPTCTWTHWNLADRV